MRNIALLEWGPASLYHLQPRERIKVRTQWLEGGPQMPPFLSTMEDAKAHSADLCVRYALSAFEDLNSVIKNLRRCFGFPYAEYIGYLNTLTRTHRARREHEGLLAGLRRWAIFGNVDAVVWIDYAKANQPPGSFKVGPRESRPFSLGHMELCAHGQPGAGGPQEHDGEESEVAWSDVDEQEGGSSPQQQAAELGASGQLRWGSEQQHESSRQASKALPREAAAHGLSLGGLRVPLRKLQLSGRAPSQDSGAKSARKAPGGQASEERGPLQAVLQEEVVPAHGSIYQRSIAPGPGYYGTGDVQPPPEGSVGPSFGRRQPSVLDRLAAASEELPGPCEYEPKPALAELRGRLGRFGRAEKMVSPIDAARKLPFISQLASACESYGLHSPSGAFLAVNPDAPCHTHGHVYAPKYSFGKCRRPF